MIPRTIIERAYMLLNTPIDPNLKCPFELADIVNYKDAEPGEIVEYFGSPDKDREEALLVSINADGDIDYHKVPLKETTELHFVGIQSDLETILLDEIMNSRDQTALASKKDGIITGMDNREVKNVLDLCVAVDSQKIVKGTGKDLLDVIIEMKQKVSNYSTEYILLVASDVMDAIEAYDKANITNFHYAFPIKVQLEELGIKKLVKIIGTVNVDGSSTKLIADGTAILVGQNSKIAFGRPLWLVRRKFMKEIAEFTGADEGAVRLVEVAKTPIPVNDNGKNTLGYSCFGYESVIQVLTNFRAVSYCENIIA